MNSVEVSSSDAGAADHDAENVQNYGTFNERNRKVTEGDRQ